MPELQKNRICPTRPTKKLYHWLYLTGFCLGDAFLYVSWTPGAQSDKMLGGCTLDLGSSPYRWRLFARSILTIEKKVRYNRYNFRNVFILYSKHPANEKECISGAKMRKVQLWYNPVQPGTTRYNPRSKYALSPAPRGLK